MSGGFVSGFVRGAVLSFVVAGAASLMAPLSPRDPGTDSQVDLATPASSGFNAQRSDTNPVLPDTDQSVATDPVRQPETSADPAVTPSADTTPAAQPRITSGVEAPVIDEDETELALMAPSTGDDAPVAPPVLGVPMPEIDDPVAEVPTHRLPQIADPVTEVVEPPEISQDGTADGVAPVVRTPLPTAPLSEDGTSLMRNRVAYSDPEGRPMMSIVLIYAGEDGLDLDMLRTFSFPITFAIPADAPDATRVAKTLASEGFEVMAMAPSSAAGWTAETAAGGVAEVLQTIPEAVAFGDGAQGVIQSDQPLAAAVIAALKPGGYGLLTLDLRLNTTDKLAQKEGLRATTIFNVLDRERESGVVIKRYLDRAALKAGQVGRVVVIGHSYPETVTALFSWAMSDRPATVALAPVSAVLLAK